jgi:hypothetical protein
MFALPRGVRQVVTVCQVDERTVAALFFVALAVAGMVAHAGSRPHIVHGPHQRLIDTVYAMQGEHSLVAPVEHDYIGIYYGGVTTEVMAEGGTVYFEEVGSRTASNKVGKALCVKRSATAEVGAYLYDAWIIAGFLDDQQTCIDALTLQCFQQSVGDN